MRNPARPRGRQLIDLPRRGVVACFRLDVSVADDGKGETGKNVVSYDDEEDEYPDSRQ
jgi:hypothetical protein